MAEYFPASNHSFKCMDDNNPAMPKARVRGFAGTGMIWSEEIDHMIEPLADGSDRLNVVLINTEPKETLVINTYMPTTGAANSDYAEILDEVHEILHKYSACNIIWTGDINAAVQRTKP